MVIDRYQLYVSDQPGEAVAIRVYDGVLKRILLKWQGEIARQLLDSNILPLAARCDGCRRCDKDLVHKLTLAAAAIATALDIGRDSDALRQRLDRLQLSLSPFHMHIARLLFSCPEKHLAEDEVICLLTLQNPCVSRRRILLHLDELVRWKVIQKIVVAGDRAFYDINTRPHLHIYCRRTHELHDAPSDGVLQLSGAAAGPAQASATQSAFVSL